MKIRRKIGGTLFGISCAVTFVGALATVLPLIPNDQLRLVLSSFEMPSDNVVVNCINGAMTYALHHCYGVLLCGLAGMLAGVGILLWGSRRRPARRSPYKRPAPPPADRPTQETGWTPPEPRHNPFAEGSYDELFMPRSSAPAVPRAYTPPPILPRTDAQAASPYARPEPPPADALPGQPSEVPFAGPPVVAPPPPPAPPPEEPLAPPSVAPPPAPPPVPQEPARQRPMPSAPPQAEAGTPSESGSRVIFRPRPMVREEAPAPEPETPQQQDAQGKVILDGVAYEPNDEPPKPPAPPASSRIRSTMGKHTV